MDLISQFKHYLMEDGKSNSTIVSYVGDIKGFMKFLSNKGVEFGGQLQRFYITSFKKQLIDDNYEVNTINKKINSLVCFNHFLIRQKLMDELEVDLRKDKVKVAAGSEKEVEVYTDDEVDRILFYIQDQERVSVRDRLIITLLIFTGLRVSELVQIKLKDFDFLTMQLMVCGKGAKIREVPLRPEVVEVAKLYMNTERREHKYSDSQYLLLTQRSGKMDRDAVNKLLKRIGCRLGIKMKPHKFRHTMLSRLAKKGVPLTTIAKIGGHVNIQTTARFYISCSRKDKQDAINLL